MWQRKRMEVYNTKRVKEQLSIHRQSNASHHQHGSWKSTRMALNYNPDYQGFPSQLHNYREGNSLRCSCDTCSLIKAQAMDRYYSAQGRPPLYLNSWPMVMQPRSYEQGLYPTQEARCNLQPHYQERSQPIHPRGVPLIFSQQTQPQGPTHPPIPIAPPYTVQIPHPAVQPESRPYTTTEIHDSQSNLSPPSAFNTSPTLSSKGSVNRNPLRPGGIAYDHHDFPKIVAVHSLPSSPVYVREQLIGATLLQTGSNVPTVYANQHSDDTDSHPKSSHRVCLENRYSNIEPRTDTLVETEKTSAPSGQTAEQTNIEDNDEDQSNKPLDKAESPVGQLSKSPEQYMPRYHNEAVTDVTNIGQERAARLKEVIDRDMNIRILLRRINAWQIDFNQETDDMKKFKILNLILEARRKLEKLRLNRDHINIPKQGVVLTDGEKDNSEVKEMTVGTVANNEVTNVVETTCSNITMETKEDITATPTSNFESRCEYVALPKNSLGMISPEITMETQRDKATAPKITMETQIDGAVSPNITMETQSDKVTAAQITMETQIDGAASPKITTETKSDMRMLSPEIHMETEIAGEKPTNDTMETLSNIAMEESDGICTNRISSVCAETTMCSVMETNTNVVSNANTSNTMTSTNITMTTSNSNMPNKIDTMATVDNDLYIRSSSPSPEDPASTLSSKSSKTDPKVIMLNSCQTSPKILDTITLLQPRIVVNLFDRVKLFDRRKKLIGFGDTTSKEPAEAHDDNCAKDATTWEKKNAGENKISDPNLNQIHGESSTNIEGSQRRETYDENCTKDVMTGEKKSQITVNENKNSDPNINQILGESSTNNEGSQRPEAHDENCTKDMMSRKKKSQSNVSENKNSDPNIIQILGELNIDNEGSQRPEAHVENCAKDVMTGEKKSQSTVSENKNSYPNLPNQILGESSTNEGSQLLSPALSPNIIKDPFATNEIRKKKQGGYSKATESDSDDVWTMELDETSHKAVFRRRWKRTGGPSDQKRCALESQVTDENEGLTEGEEWLSKLTGTSPPSKKRALLELRIIENENEDDDNDERIINEAIKVSPIFKNLASGPLKRSIHSREDPTSSLYPIDKAEPPQDLLENDLEMVGSPSNDPSLYSQDGGIEEMAALSGDDFEESIFILERSLQLREGKIRRLNEKKEQLLDELKRIKANTLSSVPRDL